MKNKPGVVVLVIALLALAAKLYCAATTEGTTDTLLFGGFGRFIEQNGLIKLYLKTPLFNHLPLIGNYVGLVSAWSGGDAQRFAFLNRLPGILADFGVVLIMLWVRRRTGQPPWWALALLAASPVCFMISGYHGNYDSLIPLGLALAVIACMQERFAFAGVMFGLACQVKIIPLVVGPVLFFHCWQRKKALPFSLAAAGTILAGWCAPLLTIPDTFIRQVVVYNSIWGWWGITYLLNKSGLPGMSGILLFQEHTAAQNIVMNGLKLVVIAGALFIAWRRRKEPAASMLGTMGLVWAVFFTFAPGFGVQYLAWVSPFLLFYSSRWFAAFTGAASLGLFIFYDTISGGMPWKQGYRLEQLSGIWAPWLLVPWVVFVAIVIASRRDLFGIPTRDDETESSAPPVPPAETAISAPTTEVVS